VSSPPKEEVKAEVKVKEDKEMGVVDLLKTVLSKLDGIENRVSNLEKDTPKSSTPSSVSSQEVPQGAVRKKFIVSLKDCARREVEVDVFPGMDVVVHKLAVEKFNQMMGVRSSVHQHEVSEVTDVPLGPEGERAEEPKKEEDFESKIQRVRELVG
jgi:hypothetical protein